MRAPPHPHSRLIHTRKSNYSYQSIRSITCITSTTDILNLFIHYAYICLYECIFMKHICHHVPLIEQVNNISYLVIKCINFHPFCGLSVNRLFELSNTIILAIRKRCHAFWIMQTKRRGNGSLVWRSEKLIRVFHYNTDYYSKTMLNNK